MGGLYLLLLLLVFLPLAGAVLLFGRAGRAACVAGAAVATLDLLLAAAAAPSVPFSAGVPWIPDLGVALRLSLDGLNLPLVLLTPLLAALALALTPRDLPRAGEYTAWMLGLTACLQGVFLADNLGLFYVFWELMLLPAWMLLGRWGGDAGRRAAVKLLLYTLAGSLVMLLGVVYMAFVGSAPVPNLDFPALTGLGLDPWSQTALLMLFAFGFAVKLPLLPVHGWLPDTYEAAPAPVVALVAGAMSKAGVYGFLKVGVLLFPSGMERLAPALGTFAAVSLLYGAFCGLGAERFRQVLAYSSLSHMGMMVLGVASLREAGFQGASLQMFNHGVTTGGLFLVAGLLEARGLPRGLAHPLTCHPGVREGSTRDRLGGLARPMPRMAAVTMFLVMASLGLPGLNSYPGELLLLLGAFQASPLWAVLGGMGVGLAGWYLLRLYQRSFHGPGGSGAPEDLRGGELAALLPLLVLVVWLGACPGLLVEAVTPALQSLLGGGGSL